MANKQDVKPGARFRHYRNNEVFTVVLLAKSANSNADVVVYRGEDGRLWTRSLMSFTMRVQDITVPIGKLKDPQNPPMAEKFTLIPEEKVEKQDSNEVQQILDNCGWSYGTSACSFCTLQPLCPKNPDANLIVLTKKEHDILTTCDRGNLRMCKSCEVFDKCPKRAKSVGDIIEECSKDFWNPESERCKACVAEKFCTKLNYNR